MRLRMRFGLRMRLGLGVGIEAGVEIEGCCVFLTWEAGLKLELSLAKKQAIIISIFKLELSCANQRAS